MYLRAASVFFGLLAVSTLAFAQDSRPDSKPRRAPAVNLAATKERAAKTHVATAPAAASEHEENARHGRSGGSDRHKRREEPGSVGALEHDAPVAPANFPDSVGWQLIEDPATGARLGLPAKLVPRVEASRTGSRWTSAQGQIQIETFRLTEAALPALFEQEKKASKREILSSQLTADSFVISGVQGLKNFRVRAATRGAEVRGVTVLYDQATEGTMDRIATAVVGAFTAFPDPNASPVPGIRRMVEYGTAIVVSGDGDLITTAHVTDDCQAITLPGLGHVERVATDKANDLALLHVYGARNLVPAALVGDANGTDFKLIGIADPLAQAGGAEVTSAVCRRTGQGIEPAPKSGFAGAAVTDGRGAVVGMVEFKPSAVAGGGAQGATLVPSETIWAFLQARGITPTVAASDHAPIELSVVRVACVRK
jgi:hypothetical protein